MEISLLGTNAENCWSETLMINVSAPLPVFAAGDGYDGVNIQGNVNICTKGLVLDVFAVTIYNTNECTVWNYSVKCSNDNKHFWVVNGTFFKTYTEGIITDFKYIIVVTCVVGVREDLDPASSAGNHKSYDVYFNPDIYTCPPTSAATTSADLTSVSLDENDKSDEFFEVPTNVILVSSFASLGAVTLLGLGAYRLARRYCKAVSSVGSAKNNDDNDDDD